MAHFCSRATAKAGNLVFLLRIVVRNIVFHPTQQHANVDSLSRLPIDIQVDSEHGNSTMLFNVYQIGTLPIKPEHLRQATSCDPILAKVLNCTKFGWSTSVQPDFKPFVSRH